MRDFLLNSTLGTITCWVIGLTIISILDTWMVKVQNAYRKYKKNRLFRLYRRFK
jgi:hypothetical protein